MAAAPEVLTDPLHPALPVWPRVGRYAFAVAVSTLVWVGGAVERLDAPLTEAQQDTAYAVIALDLVLGLVSLALLSLRRRHPLGVACTVVALLSVSAASFGPALVAIVSMGTWRRRPWAVLTGGVFLTGLLVVIVLGSLVISGASAGWIVGLLVAGVVVSVGAVQLGVLDAYQVDRFAAFADPTLDPRGVGYNVNQARIAIGSGGLTGTGLFEGTQTNGRFIPEQQTDFIFTVAGEELGLAGASALLALLGVVLWRGLRIASQATDRFGRLVAAGVVSWLAFQSFVNIGMTMGIMPVTGLPLPFVSYGGSAMLANLCAVGLLQNVHLRSQEP